MLSGLCFTFAHEICQFGIVTWQIDVDDRIKITPFPICGEPLAAQAEALAGACHGWQVHLDLAGQRRHPHRAAKYGCREWNTYTHGQITAIDGEAAVGLDLYGQQDIACFSAKRAWLAKATQAHDLAIGNTLRNADLDLAASWQTHLARCPLS
jgi:hypothetical protein